MTPMAVSQQIPQLENKSSNDVGRKFDVVELLIGVACGAVIAANALFLAVIPLARHLSGGRDFVVYWATGQQLIHHANPYDPVAMGLLEHAAGYIGKGSYYMRNPPWSLPLALPLGYLNSRLAALPWSLLMLGILILSVRIVWGMWGKRDSQIAWLGYCFPPALQCVVMGQTSLFLLLGLVLFLRYHRTRPFWAGASLWLCTLKPHLFLPFGVALLLWIAVTRSYRILAGAAAALAASCALTEWIDPGAWGQYLHWAGRSGIASEFIPCLAVELRQAIAPAKDWIAFVPAAIACVWAAVWFWRKRQTWDWVEDGNLLMLVSVLVAPYCWIYDQCLAMPALLYAAAKTKSRKALGTLAVLFLVLELQPYLFGVGLESRIFLWPAFAWVAWYWGTMRRQSGAAEQAAVSGTPVGA
jgi:hypothetical protein